MFRREQTEAAAAAAAQQHKRTIDGGEIENRIPFHSQHSRIESRISSYRIDTATKKKKKKKKKKKQVTGRIVLMLCSSFHQTM